LFETFNFPSSSVGINFMKKEIAGDTSKAVTCSRNAAKLGYEVTENDEYEGTSF